MPVEARWAKPEDAFRRLESLRAETRRPSTRELLIACVYLRTLSPSLGSCPASGGASSILPASALLVPPRGLAAPGRARREMRPIDFCHPNVSACTRTSRTSRLATAARAAWAPHGLWDPCGLTGGPDGFTPSENASADRDEDRTLESASRDDAERAPTTSSVGVVFPRSPSRPCL